MDENVMAAMHRWPNVPDVFGWLSLSVTGQWRLHPAGDALADADLIRDGRISAPSRGEPIQSQQINRFINRNYGQDTHHRWFFQNGPQRVYVRLDCAPYVLHTTGTDTCSLAFMTHNGFPVRQIRRWCVDDLGHVYADTELGAGLVAGRDLEFVLDGLHLADGTPVYQGLDMIFLENATQEVRWGDGPICPLETGGFDQMPDMLGFVRQPQPLL